MADAEAGAKSRHHINARFGVMEASDYRPQDITETGENNGGCP